MGLLDGLSLVPKVLSPFGGDKHQVDANNQVLQQYPPPTSLSDAQAKAVKLQAAIDLANKNRINCKGASGCVRIQDRFLTAFKDRLKFFQTWITNNQPFTTPAGPSAPPPPSSPDPVVPGSTPGVGRTADTSAPAVASQMTYQQLGDNGVAPAPGQDPTQAPAAAPGKGLTKGEKIALVAAVVVLIAGGYYLHVHKKPS